MDESQLEEQPDIYNEDLELYLEFYKESSNTLYSIQNLLGENFYSVLFNALSGNIEQWLESVLIVCVASVKLQKEDVASSSIEKLFEYALSTKSHLTTSLLFIATHAKWLRINPKLLEHVLKYIMDCPITDDDTQEFVSFSAGKKYINLM